MLGELAVLQGGGGVPLGLVVIAMVVEVRRLVMVMSGGVMVSGRLMMVLGGQMFGRKSQ